MGDLRDVAKAGVHAAMQVIGPARKVATLASGQTDVYDSDTGTTIQTGGTSTPIKGVFYLDRQTQGRDIPGTTRSFVCEAADAPATLGEANTITDSDGNVWQITDVETDPLDASKILRLRK